MAAPTVVVIGGGISGLSAAYYLQRNTPRIGKVIVLEATKRTGGWMSSALYKDGSVFEHGPRSLRPVGKAGQNTLCLVEELGLEKDILVVHQSDPAAKNRYLYVKGKLCALPNGFGGLLKWSAPFSKPLLANVLGEPFAHKNTSPDESIYAFIKRRLGKEFADYAADAMCRGIFAGDSRQLSMRSCFPDVFEMERKHGSLIMAAFKEKGEKEVEETPLMKRAKEEKWATWSLKHGLQQLSDAITSAIKANRKCEVRVRSPCLGLTPSCGRLKVKTHEEEIVADYVMSATFAKDLSLVLPNKYKNLRKQLLSIPAVSVYVVNLEYDGERLPVQGFGHLLPSSENPYILGVVYDSCTFPEHDRTDHSSTRLTVMMGGAWLDKLQKDLGELPSDEAIVKVATDAVSKQLGLHPHLRPTKAEVHLEEDCIPQYHLGHFDKIAKLEAEIKVCDLPIHLIGSSYKGVSVNDCINNSRKEVEAMWGKLSWR